ncbi:hypothetical protein L6R52_12305 [Myxococcota bacterium]|nr:hypothetical protein [Myxococcota bacterium]
MRSVKPALVAVLCALPSIARANPWDLYGFNPRAVAMAGSLTAGADDFTAVYYNPASLTIATTPGFGLGFVASRPRLTLDFDKAERAIPDLAPPKSDGVTFGAVFPLGGKAVKNRIVLGLGLSVPTRSLLNGQALDPAIPHWYMYQSLPSRLVAVLGLGVLPVDWLSLGAGVQILAGVSGSLDYELDIVAGRFSRKTVVFDIQPQAAPLVGLELRPARGLRIGATYRSAIESLIDLPVDLEVTGIASLEVLTNFRVQYTPHQIALGASWDVGDLELRFTGDLTYALWSKAPDPSVSSRLDAGGELFEGTGIGDAFDAPAPGQERAVALAFRDVVLPRLGVEKNLGPFVLRGGYAIRPSPAPVQTSGTNYVDATTHQISIGAGLTFQDPFDAFTNPLVVDVAASGLFVAPRRYEKIDPQDPIGSYDASGVIWVFGIALRYSFEEGRGAPVAPRPVEGLSEPAPAEGPPTEPTREPDPSHEPEASHEPDAPRKAGGDRKVEPERPSARPKLGEEPSPDDA